LADSLIASACRRAAVFAALILVALACAATTPARAETVVSLTFDDGAASQLFAKDPLLAHRMRGTFFINSGTVGTDGYFMTWQEIAGLAAYGNEIGGHTLHHTALTGLPTPAERQAAVCDDRQNLIAHGHNPVTFAYPEGKYDAGIEAIVQGCGYSSARTVGGLYNDQCTSCKKAESIPPNDPYAFWSQEYHAGPLTLTELQRYVTQAEGAGGGWVPITFHDICKSCAAATVDGSISPADFTALLDWLAARAPSGTVVKSARAVMGFSEPELPGQVTVSGGAGSRGLAARDTATAFASLRVSKRQRVGRLRVSAAMAEPGTLSAAGTVKPGKRYRVKRASARATPGKLVTLRLKLSKKGLRAVKRALGRHRRVRAAITITATDTAGNATTAKRTIRLRR
jgi:peptidoglycan/xylan/chitin deacetylase (PgdA/CDA1 family)